MSEPMRFHFSVWAPTAEEAEEIRQYVEEKLDSSHFPQWAVDEEIDRVKGAEEEDDERTE